MTETPRFCEQCGAALNPGARFCAQCGHAVQQPPARPAAPAAPAHGQEARRVSAAPEPSSNQERAVGVIAGIQRRKGLFGSESFSLIVTPERLVFALMTQQMMNDAVRQAQEEAKREGKGLLARMAAQMGWLNIMVQRYAAMPVEAALAEQSENFFLRNDQVRMVRLEHRRDAKTHQSSDHLIIEAISGKYQFELRGGGREEARQVLETVLGAAVR